MADRHHQAFIRLRSTSGGWLVHPDLRARLVADANEYDTNLTEMVVSILAAHYRVSHDHSVLGRRAKLSPADEILNVRIPGKLWTAIRRAAFRNGRRDLDEIRHTLCAHYSLSMP